MQSIQFYCIKYVEKSQLFFSLTQSSLFGVLSAQKGFPACLQTQTGSFSSMFMTISVPRRPQTPSGFTVTD